MDTINQSATVVAAAATAAGQCPEAPTERRVWEARVRSLADFLWAETAALQARTAMVAKEIELTGVVTVAEAHAKGRGRVVVAAGGKKGPDSMWTPFLAEPEGRDLLERAKELVGKRVVVTKRSERESPDSTVTRPRLMAIRPADPTDRPGPSSTGRPEGTSRPVLPGPFLQRAEHRFGLSQAQVEARAAAVVGSTAGVELGPDQLGALWAELQSTSHV